MTKPMIELTTTRKAEATLAEPRPMRRLRITPTTKFGRRRYYLDNWLPVPSFLRYFNDWSFRAVLTLVVVVLAAVGAGVVWTVRLVGRATR